MTTAMLNNGDAVTVDDLANELITEIDELIDGVFFPGKVDDIVSWLESPVEEGELIKLLDAEIQARKAKLDAVLAFFKERIEACRGQVIQERFGR